MFLETAQDPQESTYDRDSFLIKLQASDLQLYKKESLAQVFSCEFREISKNSYFYRTHWEDGFCTDCKIKLKDIKLEAIEFFRKKTPS